MARQANNKTAQAMPAGEVASAAKDIDLYAGYLGRLENPDPTLRSEAKGKGLKLYDEVDSDAHAGSVLQTRYLAVTGREWRVDPADDTPAAQEIAETVNDALLATNFDQARQEMLQGILYGYYPAEVIWSVVKGRVVPAKIRAKHPRRFCFDEERRLRLLTPANQVNGEELPDRKFICFTYGSSDNPYGKGLGQRLWWPVWFKKCGIKFWLIFLDKFGVPTGVGKYPASATQEQKDTLLAAVSSIQSETGVIIPESMAIELLEATRGGAVNHAALCEYMDRQISKAVLGQTASTEGTPGKLGNDETQDEVRADIIKADADLLCECLNDTLIRWIVDLNHGPQQEYPKLWIRAEDEGDLKPLAERDKILAQDLGLPVAAQYFYDTYGIPAPEQGDVVVTPSKPGPVNPMPTPTFSESPAPGPRFTPDQQALEGLADAAVAQATEALEVNEAQIIAAVTRAASYDEAMANILDLYPALDMAGLEEIMARAIFAAAQHGRQTAREANDA